MASKEFHTASIDSFLYTPIWSLRDFVVSERFQPVSCDLATLYLVYKSAEKTRRGFRASYTFSANVEAFEQCSLKGFVLTCICHQIYFSRRIANVGENCPCKILPCKLANCPTTTRFSTFGVSHPPPLTPHQQLRPCHHFQYLVEIFIF